MKLPGRSRRTSSDREFRTKFGPALLYLDDVNHIYDMLLKFSRKVSDGQSFSKVSVRNSRTSKSYEAVTILAADFHADAVEDLKEVSRSNLNQLSLSLSHPDVTIKLWKEGAEVTVKSPGLEALEFVSSVRGFVNSRRNIWVCFYRFSIAYLLLLIGAAAFTAVTAVFFTATPSSGQWWRSLILLVALTIGIVFIWSRYHNTVRVAPVWRGESARRRRTHAWWIATTVLVCVAGVGATLSIIARSQPQYFWHSIVFQDLANIGTFAAAAAAWVTATVASRASRNNKNDRKTSRVDTDSDESSGMTDNDLEFMRTLMTRMARGDLDDRQVAQIERVLKALKARPEIELPDISSLPPPNSASREVSEWDA